MPVVFDSSDGTSVEGHDSEAVVVVVVDDTVENKAETEEKIAGERGRRRWTATLEEDLLVARVDFDLRRNFLRNVALLRGGADDARRF